MNRLARESRTHLSLLTVQPGKALFQNTYVAKVQVRAGGRLTQTLPLTFQPHKGERMMNLVQSHLTIDFPIKGARQRQGANRSSCPR